MEFKKKTLIHFKSDAFAAVVVVDAKTPCSFGSSRNHPRSAWRSRKEVCNEELKS